MTLVNEQVRLAHRPVGFAQRSDFDFTTEPVGSPQPGHVLAEVVFASLDPAMRGWMNDRKSYIEPIKLGEVMRAGGICRILESAAEGFRPGDYVYGRCNIQRYVEIAASELQLLDPDIGDLTVYLGALGNPGMTAYFGLLDIGKPQPGQTVVVSGAAGAVGSVVGQIARIKGCRVVGIAGGEAKCRVLVDEFNFDAAIDYKAADFAVQLSAACPAGIDVFFDNVGGDVLDAALTMLARNARIIICGAVSQYNVTGRVTGPANYLSLLVQRATMTGMVVYDYQDRFDVARQEIGVWIKEGKLKTLTHVTKGLDKFPEALLDLFSGANTGKFVLQIGEP